MKHTFITLTAAALLMVPGTLQAQENWEWLFNGRNLDGWTQINGTADYEVEKGVIIGTTKEGSPNSFLCTEEHYSDFILEFMVMVDPRLNSGVQIRSNSFEDYRNYRVHGYQVEIEAQSGDAGGDAGFIYDEARRGWLSPEEKRNDLRKRTVFKNGEWNHYRVECIGDSIKTWVNGVLIADLTDDMTESGFIGLQVHSFGGEHPAWVKWKNIRLLDLSD